MNFLSRLLGRKPPPEDRRNMNEDWKVGDLAVCIVSSWQDPSPGDPREGELNRVAGICEGTAIDGNLYIALKLAGKSPSISWVCRAFRKVRPDHKAEESDISRRIRACKSRERERV